MASYIFLAFLLVPIVEIALLISVGSSIGLLPTLVIIIATAVLGTFMLRQQGLSTLQKAQSRMASGELPAQQLMEGMILLVGGVLLLTPGFATDAFGFICLFPLTRQWIAARMAKRSISGSMPGGGRPGGGNAGFGSGFGATFSSGSNSSGGRSRPPNQAEKPNREPDVIEGSFREED